MAQTPLLVAIDFGALVERELRADGKGSSLRKARTRKPEWGSSERASGPAPPICSASSSPWTTRARLACASTGRR